MRTSIRPADPGRPRVFGIGLRKTGTRSLAVATRELGFRTLHKGGRGTSELVDRAEREGVPLLTHLGNDYDVYLDVESLVHGFVTLDEQYPGSRFVLTTRPFDAWARSVAKHVAGNVERHARGDYDGDLMSADIAELRATYENHHDAVRRHFRDRPQDLLEIDLTAGAGWEQLAPFLDAPIPDSPFPWENRDGSGTYRSLSPLDRVAVRGRALRQAARRMVAPRRVGTR